MMVLCRCFPRQCVHMHEKYKAHTEPDQNTLLEFPSPWRFFDHFFFLQRKNPNGGGNASNVIEFGQVK